MNKPHCDMKEFREQVQLFVWAEQELLDPRDPYPDLIMLRASSNGGKHSKGEAGKMKAAGQKAGVPDIILEVARGGYHGLQIELKVDKSQPTDKQPLQAHRLSRQGYRMAFCWGWEAARELIIDYLEDREMVKKIGKKVTWHNAPIHKCSGIFAARVGTRLMPISNAECHRKAECKCYRKSGRLVLDMDGKYNECDRFVSRGES